MRDLLVFAVVLLTLPASFRRPFVGLLVFSWLAYMRPQDLCWGFARTMRLSFFVGITMVVGWWANEQGRRRFTAWDVRTRLIVLLAALITISYAFAQRHDDYTNRYFFEYLKIVVVALFTVGQVDSRERLRAMLWTIALSLGFFGVKGGAFGLLTGGGQILRGPGGMLEDNNDFALALVMNVPLLWYLGIAERDKPWVKRATQIAVGLTVVTILLTHSRGGFLALCGSSLWIAWRSGRLLRAGMVLLALAALFPLLAPAHVLERLGTIGDTGESSANARFIAWGTALRMIEANPLLGVGMRNFQSRFLDYSVIPPTQDQSTYVAHNSYLQIWAESGSLAFLVYLLLLASVFVTCRKVYALGRQRPDLAWAADYARMMEATTVGFLIGAFFLNRGHFDLIYHWLALASSLAAVAFAASRRGPATAGAGRGARRLRGAAGANGRRDRGRGQGSGRLAARGAVALMCGIAGMLAASPQAPVDPAVAVAMADRLRHRGPDGDGVRGGPGYALAHRRLAIVDRAGGAQPMGTADGRLWVTFNGEIYNHLELRAELAAGGAEFRTRSDTEVLLHGYRAWGTDLASRLRGMFAFAIVDEANHELYAARDRLGKKPFHWCLHDGRFVFASELKALAAAGVPRRLRTDAIAQFLALRYVPDPATVYHDVHKLPPAHWCRVRDGRVELQRYWRLEFAVDDRPRAQHEERLLALLDEAVRIRLMGEVPLAPFLSGGLDSYAIVDSMTRTLGRPVTACTIGFTEPRFDERPAARAAAAAVGASLHEEVLAPADLLDLDWLAATYDEPFADSSAVPTYHVSRLARRHVTVALSGDGGDEAFGGYRRYLFDVREHRARPWLPGWLWRLAGAAWPKADWLPRPFRWKRTLQDLGRSPAEAYARSVSAHLPEEVFAVLRREHHAAAGNPHAPLLEAYDRAQATAPLHRAMATDLATWLPGDLLVKADRASMAVSLEIRCPLLDHRLLEAAARIPAAWHLEGGRTKAFLRRALASRLLPAALQRQKQGFSVPLRAWCRGPIGDAVEVALAHDRLAQWIDPVAVRRLLQRHRAGTGDHGEMLWAVLVLSRFLGRWGA
ncbi:MAG: asparagine synthase (glutamine-hydrolyzing) [Planctomycetes bacterium]|nr:asparagine synthase (glutamine-hydrolyzing) [Planctomycetota bacterium]